VPSPDLQPLAVLLRGAGPAEQAAAARVLGALAADGALRHSAAAAVPALCIALAGAVAAAGRPGARRLRRRLVLAPAAAARMGALTGVRPGLMSAQGRAEASDRPDRPRAALPRLLTVCGRTSACHDLKSKGCSDRWPRLPHTAQRLGPHGPAGALRLLTLDGGAKRAVAGDGAALQALGVLLRARSVAVAEAATAVVWNVATEEGARGALLQARGPGCSGRGVLTCSQCADGLCSPCAMPGQACSRQGHGLGMTCFVHIR